MSRPLHLCSIVVVTLLVVAAPAAASLDLTAGPSAMTPAETTFHVSQDGDCYEINAYGSGDQTVSEFYDYRKPTNSENYNWTYSSHGTKELQKNQASNIFVYHGSEGYSIVLLHDKLDVDEEDGEYGSTITFEFSNMSDVTWEVQDDVYSFEAFNGQMVENDDNWTTEGSTHEVDWMWADHRTDGGAFSGFGDAEITITPYFNEDAPYWNETSETGTERPMEEWRVLGEDGATVTTLDMDQELSIAKGECPDTTDPAADLTATPNEGFGETEFTFDASGSADDREIDHYRWDVDGNGDFETTTDAPQISQVYSEPGDHEVTVQVVDAAGNTDTASTIVTVFEISSNDPPAADAGDDQTVDEGTSVTLDGTESTDPDGDSLAYAWTQVGSGPSVELTDADTAIPTFTAPDVDSTTTLTFELTVADGHGNTDTDTVTITVEPTTEPNTPPAADAGNDQTVEEAASVTLNAGGSTDPDGDTLTYRWQQTGGEIDVDLSDADTATPTFTAPSVTETTELTFEVTVADGDATATDTVTVTVEPTTEQSVQEALVDRLTEIAADGDITRAELSSLVEDLTPALVQLLQSITADGTISDADIDRLADAIAEERQS